MAIQASTPIARRLGDRQDSLAFPVVLLRTSATLLALLAFSTTKTSACEITFLPDDAQVACRAILPQCFTRSAWAELCRSNQDVMESHPDACRQALEPQPQ
jgi:hypothetical protein